MANKTVKMVKLAPVSSETKEPKSSSNGVYLSSSQNAQLSRGFDLFGVASKDYDFAEVMAKAGFGVAKLARAHGLSVRQLERKFHEQFGACPREILQKIRMGLAQERLHSDAPLKQIAADLKYKHASDFTRAFRHCYHMSPAQMRSKLAEKSRRVDWMSYFAK